MSVETAEKILTDLQAKRQRLVARGVEIGDQRASVAYDAHADGSAKDEKILADLHREAAEHASQLAGLDSAIKVAEEKLAKAREREATRADRESAQALKAEVKAFVACGQEIVPLVSPGNKKLPPYGAGPRFLYETCPQT